MHRENYCLPYCLRWLRTNQEIFRRTANGAYEASLKREFRRWIVRNFLGYDKGDDGKLIVNQEQAKIVKRIYREFLNGYNPATIAKC